MERTVVDNRYDVVRPLGSGGMGEVYLARDQILDREVALKVLRRQYAGDSEFAERFKREALNAASLSHPNIIQVYDRGETQDGAAYIAMEYVPGGTLKERITRSGPIDPAEAAYIGSQVADALGAAHERGVIHRDIKPQNVLLTERSAAKVGDFGIARAASAATISQTGSVMGTASYMSPEQALGKPATPKSDLYSLGVVLYEALTGELPFTADNPIAVSMKHVNEPVRPPKAVNPEIPASMNALVVKLLAKDPDIRYADAEELAEALWSVRRGLAPGPESVTRSLTQATKAQAVAPVARAIKGRRLPVPVLLLALLALIGLAWALSSPSQNFGFGGPAQGVEVPSVEGMTRDQAVQRLDAAGLGAKIRERESSAADAGRVLDQSPPGGQSAERGSRVLLAVGAGPETAQVPEVRGLSLPDAEAELDRAGLVVGSRNYVPSETAPEGEVVGQGIAPGTDVDRGTEVNLDISSGPSSGAQDPASSASSSSSASASSSASSDPSASSASAAPAGNPSSEREQEKIERAQEKAEEKAEKEKAEEKAEKKKKKKKKD